MHTNFFGYRADHAVYRADHSTLTQLTPTQRAICQGLTEGETITAISRTLKVPRSTLYEQVGRIRRLFSSAGLKTYLE